MALDALTVTPLQDKQVTVRASRHGARGRLVITSAFAQGYTVSDVRCADEAGRPPCTAEAYDHAMVFTFSGAAIVGRGSRPAARSAPGGLSDNGLRGRFRGPRRARPGDHRRAAARRMWRPRRSDR
jgi:hypothetical protein